MANKVSVVVDIQAQTSAINQEIQKVQDNLSKLKLNPQIEGNLSRGFGRISTEYEKLAQKAERGFSSQRELDSAQDKLKQLSQQYANLMSQLKGYTGSVTPADLLGDDASYKKAKKNLDDLEQEFKAKVQSIKKMARGTGTGGEKTIERLLGQEQGNAKKIVSQFSGGEIDYKTALSELTKSKVNAGMGLKQNQYAAITSSATDISKSLGRNEYESILQDKITSTGTGKKTKYQLGGQEINKDQKVRIEELRKEYDAYLENEKIVKNYYDVIKNALEEINNLSGNKAAAGQVVTDQEVAAMKEYKAAVKEITGTNAQVQQSEQQLGNAVHEANGQLEQQQNIAKRRSELTSYFSYMFSATAILMKLRQAISGAIEDFKQLDKQFNEISIVSGRSMEELWGNFDSLNRTAQQYGVTTSDVVSVQKLYYQQGKSAAQVTQLTNETLKFAKISGLEFADATDKMTAALNAFNLQANEASRITDVYSALSSRAAATSEEISVAMSKVASLAGSAGTGLEDTATYLTKIIETTREAPETAGTALKTIIARFSEIKKLTADEQELLGEDYNFNNIEKALKTVGIQVKDSAGQMRSFSDIIGELGPKWDSLSTNEQRYIATMAAGSRQQSRFIALMDNWGRTEELSGIAAESAGTGAQQLDRALQSLETSLNRLKASWQSFYTNFIKSSFVKGVIDSVNSLVGVLAKVPGYISAPAILIGAKMAKSIGKGLKDNILKPIKETATTAGASFAQQWRKKTRLNKIGEKGINYSESLQRRAKFDQYGITKEWNKKRTKGVTNFDTGLSKSLKQETALYTKINNLKGKNLSLSQNEKELLADKLVQTAKENKIDLAKISQTQTQQILQGQGIDLSTNQAKAVAKLTRDKYANIAVTQAETVAEAEHVAGASGAVAANEIKDFSLKNLIKTKWAEVTANLAVLASDPFTWVILGAAIAAITAVTVAIRSQNAAKERTANLNQNLTESQNNYTEALKKYNSASKKFQRYKELMEKPILSTEEHDELQEVIDELAETYPELVSYHDEEGNAVLKETDAIAELVEQKKADLEITKRAMLQAKRDAAEGGIYDTNTSAGQALERLKTSSQPYATAADTSAFYGRMESWMLGDADDIKETLTTLQEEGASFNRETLSDLLGTSVWEDEWDNLVKKISEEGIGPEGIGRALKESISGLDDADIKNFEKMNEAFGNSLSELIASIPKAMEEIDIQEAKIDIQNAATKYGVDLDTDFVDFLSKSIADKTKTQKTPDKLIVNKGDTSTTMTVEQVREGIKNGTIKRDDIYDPDTPGQLITEEQFNYLAGNEYLINSFIEALSKVDDTTLKSKLGNIVKTFGELTYDQVKELKDKPDAIYSLLGISDPEKLPADVKAGIESMVQQFTEEANKDLEKNRTGLQRYLSNAIINKLTPQQIKSLNNQVAAAVEAGGNGDMFANTFSTLQGLLNEEDIGSLFAVDFQDEDSINNFLTTLIQKYGATSEQVKYYNGLIQQSGPMTKKSLQTAEQVATKLKKDVSSINDKFTKLSSALQGNLGFEDMIELVEKSDGKLDYGMFTATADGFAMSQAAADNYRKALLADKKAEYEAMIATKKETLAQLKAKTAIDNTTLSMLEQARAAGTMTDRQKEQYEELKKQLEARQVEIDKVSKEIVNAEQSIKLINLAFSQLNQAEVDDKIDRTISALKNFIDLLKDIIYNFRSLDNYLEDLQQNLTQQDFEINFSVNPQKIYSNIKDKINTLNNLISGNMAKSQQAAINAQSLRNTLATNYGQYVSFDEAGNLITNNDAITAAAERIKNLAMSPNERTQQQAEREKESIDNMLELAEAYTTQKKAIKDAESQAEEYFKQIEDTIKAAQQSIKTLEDKLFSAFQTRDKDILDSLEKRYNEQKKLDSEYLKTVKDAIQEERNLRNDTDSQKELEQQERKLQLLKMSGGSATQIQSLEQEVAKKRQQIADKEIDNLLNELDKETQVKNEAMDRELEYQKTSLDNKIANRIEYNQEIAQLMAQDQQTIISTLQSLDKEYKASTDAERAIWMSETLQVVAQAQGAMMALADGGIAAVQWAYEGVKSSTAQTKDVMEGYVNYVNQTSGGVVRSIDTIRNTYVNLASAIDAAAKAQREYNSALSSQPSSGSYSSYTLDDYTPEAETTYEEPAVVRLKYGGKTTSDQTISNAKLVTIYGEQYYTNGRGNYYPVANIKRSGSNIIAKNGSIYYKRYATGGMVNYTGPAWVDGTPSKPEAFLSAKDTALIASLTDALSFSSHSFKPLSTSQITGDTYYEFHINVDKLGEGYSVDDLVEELEEHILNATGQANAIQIKR